MILSVSRRTDIPAFYGRWFLNRLQAGAFYVRNPYNKNLVSLIEVSRENVDCLVFWTKNAINFMQYLTFIDDLGYNYYFHYTITPYHEDLEILNNSKKEIVTNFKELSTRLGKEKVILRYDPILLNDKYDIAYHFKAFIRLCGELKNYTKKVVVSFLDVYQKNSYIVKQNNLIRPNLAQITKLMQGFSKIAQANNLELVTCAEEVALDVYGIKSNSCIDKELIEKITNKKFKRVKYDKTREFCLCLKCIDIGTYNTCQANCKYCYANNKQRMLKHDENSLLLNDILKDEKIVKRKDVTTDLE